MIECKDINFSYLNSNENALSDINCEIKKGECVLLCGLSGSGKSSFSRILNGLIPNYFKGDFSGYCNCFGIETVSEIEKYVPVVGSVFQNPKTQFFNVEVKSELAFPCENCGIEAEIIEERISTISKSLKIEELLYKNVFQLSGGQQQQVAIASANMLDNDLLVLDEPSANLDLKAIDRVRKQLDYCKSQGKTIVIAEHRLAWLNGLVDKYFFFEKGKLVNIYNREEFLALDESFFKEKGLRQIDLSKIKDKVLSKKEKKCEKEVYLSCGDLSVGYKRKEVAYIKELSLAKGEVVALVGENGVGKSTLAKTLCGLLKPIKGEIKTKNIKSKNKERIKKSFMVMQDVNYQLFADSVIEEIALGIEDKEKVEEVLNELDLFSLKDRHPLTLSGGQKQRVAIASALLSEKELIIFDEPTSGLDSLHMHEFAKLLKKHLKDKCVLILTHDEELVAEYCDRVIDLSR